MQKRIFIALLGCIFSTAVFSQQPAFVTDSLDAYIQREMARWNIPGLAISIVKEGRVVVAKGYGVTDNTTKHPVDGNTLFMVASNTKLFTGTGLAMLAVEHQISLTDPVVKYLPYFKMYNDTLTSMVTIEDLLSHRMGFETFQGDFYNWANNDTRKNIIMNMAKNKPVYDFRDEYGYCNAGFVTAGAIIEAVSGMSYEEFMSHRILSLMNMNRSSLKYGGIVNDPNACKPYTMFQGKLVELKYDNLDNIAPCAGLNTCVNDFSNWLIAQAENGLYNGRPAIALDVINETRTPRTIVDDGHSSLFKSQHFDLYGLGCELTDYEGREIISHTGGADGFVTAVCIVPEEHLGIAVFTNTDVNYLFMAAVYQILEAYFKMPYRNLSAITYQYYQSNSAQDDAMVNKMYDLAKKPGENSLPLESYAGTYRSEVYGKMEAKVVDGKLQLKFEHHPQLTGNLLPLGHDEFVCTYDPISWGVKKIPFKVENGKVVSATITVNDFIDFMPYEFVKQ